MRKPRPERAIDARRRDAAAKVTAVDKAVKALGRMGVPVTRAGVARLAEVSRSFTYENDQADSMIVAAQYTDHGPSRRDGGEQITAQQEAAWKERALNAEDRVRHLNRELESQRQLVGDLLGRLREPDGTWLEDERNQLRQDNEAFPSRTKPGPPRPQRAPTQARWRTSQRCPPGRAPCHTAVP